LKSEDKVVREKKKHLSKWVEYIYVSTNASKRTDYLKVEVHEILHSRVDITPSCKQKAQWEEERMKEPMSEGLI
jgi:hypothetical protein